MRTNLQKNSNLLNRLATMLDMTKLEDGVECQEASDALRMRKYLGYPLANETPIPNITNRARSVCYATRGLKPWGKAVQILLPYTTNSDNRPVVYRSVSKVIQRSFY